MILIMVLTLFTSMYFYIKHIAQSKFDEKRKQIILFIIGMALLVDQIILKGVNIYNREYYYMWYGDMCEALCLLSIIGIVFKWNNFLRIISTWSIIGSLLTFSIGSIQFNMDSLAWFLKSGIMHMLLFAFSVLTIVFYYKDYKRSDLFYSALFALTYILAYVIPVGYLLSYLFGEKFKFSSTAAFKSGIEFIGSDYHFFYSIPMPFPAPTIIFYIIAAFVNWLLGIGILKIRKPKVKKYFLKILLVE